MLHFHYTITPSALILLIINKLYGVIMVQSMM